MSERPDLNKELDAKTFKRFYYLKEELVSFCRENNLPVSGGKIELTDRIASFLDTGKVIETSTKRKVKINIGTITETTKIEPNIVCSEKHRSFFQEKICKSLEEAILCWKYKKGLQGHNRYEQSDLVVLERLMY